MDIINDDILIMIFEKLDRKSIFNASKVCMSWYNIITTTSILASKVTLATSIESWKDTRYVEELNLLTKKLEEFQYRNFKLSSNHYFNPRELLIINRFLQNGTSVEKLYMNSFSSTLVKSFLHFSAPTLTHLIVATSFPDESFRGRINLPCLEYLKLNSVDSVMNAFRCENLKTLEIVNCRNLNAFQRFLKNSRYLPKLKKFKTFELFWELDYIHKLPFNLQELEATHFLSIDSNILENFLLAQSKSLQKLTLKESKVRATLINFVIDNMTNLRTLNISGLLWSFSDIDINMLPKNGKIESMEMKLVPPILRFANIPSINSHKLISKILMKCENLKNLKFQGSVSAPPIIEEITPLPSLKTLRLELIEQYVFWRSFEFKNLESFTVKLLHLQPPSIPKYLRIISTMRRLKYLQVDHWLSIEDDNLMSMRNMMIFLRILSRCKTFRIKNCKIFPIKFLNLLSQMKSKRFKRVEINTEDSKDFLEEMQNTFKDEFFQTVFNRVNEEISADLWENEVESYENDDDDEHDRTFRSSFRRFMESTLYPIF